MKTRSVHFWSEGSKLAGEVYTPDSMKPGERRPGIVLCHGFSGIRELILPDYAKVFTDAGFVCLGFDYRGFGDSEGQKWRLIPLEQIDDIRNAITFLENQSEVEPSRIGVWGTSFGGGHIAYVTGVDSRVKCAVGQVGFGDGQRLIEDVRTLAGRRELRDLLAAERRNRVLEGHEKTSNTSEILQSPNTRAFIGEALKTFPKMYCEIPVETVEKTLEYKPVSVAGNITVPLLLIGAEYDDTCGIEDYQNLHDRAATATKKMVRLPIGHYEVYSGKGFEDSSRLAAEWYSKYL